MDAMTMAGLIGIIWRRWTTTKVRQITSVNDWIIYGMLLVQVISGVGIFNPPVRPDIEGLERFEGPSWHSAEWPEDADIAGKHTEGWTSCLNRLEGLFAV